MPGATDWDEFCEELKALGHEIARRAPRGKALDAVEGYRFLTRLLRSGLENQLEGAGPVAPRLEPAYAHRASFAQRNPDQLYLGATVSGDYEYAISGRRGTAGHLSFVTRSSGSSGPEGMTGALDQHRLVCDAAGRFEIALSVREQAGNWLPMLPHTDSLLVREAFLDAGEAQASELSIRRIGAGVPQPSFDATELTRSLSRTTGFVRGLLERYGDWTAACARSPNLLLSQEELLGSGGIVRAGGDPNITYYLGYWALDPEEALLIEAEPPACDWWGFQLMNWWQESINLPLSASHVNMRTADYLENGAVRIVVSSEDLGAGNWIDPAGHDHGTMLFRWIGATDPPTPRSRVVPLAGLPRDNRFSDARLDKIGAGYRVLRFG